MQIDHEAGDCALELGETLFQDHKTRARHACRGLEIHLAERFTEIEMLFGLEVQLTRLTRAADLDIVVLILAVGRVGGRHVRQRREHRFKLCIDRLLLGFIVGDCILDTGNFGHKRLGARFVFLGFRLADLLGGFVAACLQALQLGHDQAAPLIDLQYLARTRLQPAPPKRLIKAIGIVANELNVVHGRRLSERPMSIIPDLRRAFHAASRPG